MARARREELWSYSTGRKGRNRVRAYQRAPRGAAEQGTVFLRFVERAADGTLRRKKVSLGACTRDVARQKADELAGKLAAMPDRPPVTEIVTVASLFDNYGREVTPGKSRHTQSHDRLVTALFLRCVGRTRPVASLNRRDWDKFIRDRRSGVLRPPGAQAGHRVGERQVQSDCKTIAAVLRWGTTVNDRQGKPLVDRHPFAGMPMPREENPRRPRITDAEYQAMLAIAAEVHPLCRLALVLAHETGHRIGAIRLLTWFDVDLKAKRIRWRPENDKLGWEHTTPLSSAAVAELDAAKSKRLVEAAWLFPAPRDASKPITRHTIRHLWERAEEKAKLEPAERRGWHSLRRLFATELKAAPLCDLTHLGGWKSVATVVSIYQQPDEATMRAALEARRPIDEGAISHG